MTGKPTTTEALPPEVDRSPGFSYAATLQNCS
jgi:hypothetical protein